MTDRGVEIDPRRTAELWDVGGVGLEATTGVDSDGSTCYLVASVADMGSEDAVFDPLCHGVAHEQLGELPTEYTLRLHEAGGSD
jgi:hypothetical protein